MPGTATSGRTPRTTELVRNIIANHHDWISFEELFHKLPDSSYPAIRSAIHRLIKANEIERDPNWRLLDQPYYRSTT
jgi:hypothetical protein